MAIEHFTRLINKSTIRSRGGQLITFTHDLILISKRRNIMVSMLEDIMEVDRFRYLGVVLSSYEDRSTEIK